MSNFLHQVKLFFNQDNFQLLKKISKFKDLYNVQSFNNKEKNISEMQKKYKKDDSFEGISFNDKSEDYNYKNNDQDYKILNEKLEEIINNMQNIEKYLSSR